MTVSTSAAAKAACQIRHWKLSNLELQKVLYIAHMIHLGRFGEPLVDELFEAWDYGPVLPSVYSKARIFGSDPVKDVFYFANINEHGREYQSISEVARYLANKTPGQLVDLTHWQYGAWARYYMRGAKHIKIPNSAVADEFRRREDGVHSRRSHRAA